MPQAGLLAIEGGGTGTRVVFEDDAGMIVGRAEGGPASALYADPKVYPDELTHLFRAVVPSGCVPRRVGLAGPVDRAMVADVVRAQFPAADFHAYSEGEIALGACELTWGVTVVGGTGSSARAATPEGQWVEVGGFGPQFDDLGSAYWLGREAVASVLRAEHGRGPATALRAPLFAHFEIADAWGLVPLCAGNGHVPVARVAAFAPEVTRAADAGDGFAKALCCAAAEHLADLVQAATRRAGLGIHSEVPVVPTGGLFHAAQAIYVPFCECVAECTTGFCVYPAVPDPMPGLLNLLRRA